MDAYLHAIAKLLMRTTCNITQETVHIREEWDRKKLSVDWDCVQLQPILFAHIYLSRQWELECHV